MIFMRLLLFIFIFYCKLLLIYFFKNITWFCKAPLDSNGNGAIKVNVIIIKTLLLLTVIIGMSGYRNVKIQSLYGS